MNKSTGSLDSFASIDRAIELLDSAAKKKGIKELTSQIYPHLKIDNSRLYNELAERNDYKLGFRTALQIMLVTGDLDALDKIEAMFNRVAFCLPGTKDQVEVELVKVTSEMAEVFGKTMEALANTLNKKEPLGLDEARKVFKANKQLMEVCVKLQAYTEQFVNEKR